MVWVCMYLFLIVVLWHLKFASCACVCVWKVVLKVCLWQWKFACHVLKRNLLLLYMISTFAHVFCKLCCSALLIADRGRGDLKWPGELSLYRPVVRAALADVFLAYASTVKCNRQRAGLKTDSQQVPVSSNDMSLLPGDSSSCCHRENLSQPAPDICRNTPLLPCSPYSPHPEKPGSHTSFESQNLALEHELQAHKLCPCGGCGCSACAWWHLPHPPRGAGCGRGCRVAICDNYNSKVSGWRSAVSCVCCVIKMDMAITTGIDRQTQPAHSVLL